MIAVVAEKPSVARDLASVLGATSRGEGRLEGGGYIVTWAIGHLVALAQPHQMNPAWKAWRLDQLPMLPAEWPLEVVDATRAQFDVVKKILRSREVTQVIAATDAGREGELIFRYVYEAAGCKKPVSRLWISSLTPDAIRAGFARLRAGHEYDGLADAARGRSRADWLVGMNLSRAYSITFDDHLSVGRVQTPTLAMIVEREQAIRAFVPEDYLEVVAKFTPAASLPVERTRYPTIYLDAEPAPAATEPLPQYDGVFLDPKGKAARLPADGDEAKRIVLRAKAGAARIERRDAETRKLPPPLLYDLTELQRHANRLYGMSAQRTLEVAQQLYEERKVISYPRTDSRHLTTDVAKTLAPIVAAIAPRHPGQLAPGTGAVLLGKRFIDDARVTDHHAIIPTTTVAQGLAGDQAKIYDLICRRLLSAWHEDHVYATTTVITAVHDADGEPARGEPLRFESKGTAIERVGWKILDVFGAKRTSTPEDAGLPAGLVVGQRQRVVDVRALAKQTKPPPRLNDATLLTAMETAGKHIDTPLAELADAMSDVGLGTPATRAAIIETLIKREYITRDGKAIEATDKGIALIEAVHPDVKSPLMTAEWEAKLARIQRGGHTLGDFVAGIERYVTDVVGKIRDTAPPGASFGGGGGRGSATSSGAPAPARAPKGTPSVRVDAPARAPRAVVSGDDLPALLHETFGFRAFRPYQEAVCRAATAGEDVLLVMPTGAGKSLCYQLPGLARGGTTLVISPLIALMEDQVAKLQALGLVAERIHSGRDRASSRRACAQYLNGELDFLFIAPERLRVPGFPEMLAKRLPSLVAIDEAHCISKWGHDFRPDYRMLGQRLPLLRPTPVIALTATATARVQDDILEQLGLPRATRFIHGFRRTNLAIEVRDTNPGERPSVVSALLRDETRRPAIVYAPTRKAADELARVLRKDGSVAAYHAGMSTAERDRVQTAFLAGKLEIVVATIAFGMGIDKADVRTVVHVAMPGSIEGYYQEIGRAGRDGAPSRAVLLHSFVDRKTHEFFLDRDYPDVAVLERIVKALSASPTSRDALRRKLRLDGELLDKALEKLWVHGGAVVDGNAQDDEPAIRRGEEGWQRLYLAQRAHRLAELENVARFTSSHACRMVDLIRHFGDQEDGGAPCGSCDVCAPDASIAGRAREPSHDEQLALSKILRALVRAESLATGRLHAETFADGSVDRRSFEHLLSGLARAGLVAVREESFSKGKETITYQRASLTDAGREAALSDTTQVPLAPAPTKKTAKKPFFRKRRRTTTAAKPKKQKRARAGR